MRFGRPSRGGVVRGAIAAAWAALMLRMLATDVFPGWARTRLDGYRDRFAGGPPLTDQWMRILVRDVPVGFSHTRTDLRTDGGRDLVRVENRTFLRLAVMGHSRTVSVESRAEVDADHRLERFDIQLDSPPYRFRAAGRRGPGRRFDVDLDTPAIRRTIAVEIPDDAVLYSPMSDLQLARLSPGSTRRLRVFDPVSLSTADLTLRVHGRETIEIGGEPREALRVTTEYRGLEIRTWIAPDGQALRQETPFGWTLEAATPESAMAAARAGRTAPEILDAAAVPIDGGPAPDLDASAVEVRLSGAPALARHPAGLPRQTVTDAGPVSVTLRLTAAPERPAPAPPLTAEERARWLESTAFVPAEHPEIRAQARAIAGAREDPLEIAEALADWVYRNVRKNPAVSLPSALDVLREREGDCNEHTYLFVALARSLGIPARILVGLVPHEGAFLYHAWPAVHAGGWIELDPTLGRRRVGAAHIALAEGELEGQMALAGLVGRLRAEVRHGPGD